MPGRERQCAVVTQGQFYDLFPPDSTIETVLDIIYKKTVTLFEISFLFGWIFGGGDLSSIPLLKKCAYHLGMAFQIADDLEDGIQDVARGANIVTVLGRKKAIASFEEEIDLLETSLKALHLWTKPFQEVVTTLVARQRLFFSSDLLEKSSSRG